MAVLYGIAGTALLFSLIFSRQKTFKALKLAVKKFFRLVPSFFVLTIFISLFLYLVPQEIIARVLGRDNILLGVVAASLLGSVAFVPGFIAFPLCGVLREQGTSYTVLSAFTTTLMMVGVLTFPLEKEYLGMKLSVIRNIAGFLMAFAVALLTGIVFGEIF